MGAVSGVGSIRKGYTPHTRTSFDEGRLWLGWARRRLVRLERRDPGFVRVDRPGRRLRIFGIDPGLARRHDLRLFVVTRCHAVSMRPPRALASVRARAFLPREAELPLARAPAAHSGILARSSFASAERMAKYRMANTHIHHPRKPRRVRAHSERAQGLDPEFTAQPHSLSDDLDLSGDEAGLSIDPEDLGNHFLSEAVEQGDLGVHDAAELEFTLHAGESDIADIDLGMWETMTELAVQNGGTSAELRAATDFGAERLAAERERERVPAPSHWLNMHDSSTRETSLLDREGAARDRTLAPRVDSDDSGRHARNPREALGEQVSGPRAAADGGKLKTAARASLRSAAGKLRGIASKLARVTRQ
jgi:hypothetical protein